MNAETDDIRQMLVEQLSSFEDWLDSKIDDVQMLTEIQQAISHILGRNGANEAEIRRVLQERYDSGQLRKETFQLVKSMLDRFVTEQIPTGPVGGDTVALQSGDTIALNAGDTVALQPDNPIAVQASDALVPVDAPQQSQAAADSNTSTAVLPTDTTSQEAADDRAQVGSLLRDRFLLQERVAGGGMGVVYKAMDRRLAESGTTKPWVAIKILSQQLAENGQALRALQQEAAKGRCLTHPNIVRFLDLDRDENLYFMVMEWLDGCTLADILDAPGTSKIDKARAFDLVRQIGKALDYAHRCGIVHADVKPANIMIMPNGDAKLFDFGIARVTQKQIKDQPDFDPSVLGLMTPAYSSMQVLTGEEPTPADDVFSLACLLYRLLAGYRVFGPRNAAEAAEDGMKPQRLDCLSGAQWRVLKKALSYSRVTRFESVNDFIEALDVKASEPITITVPARKDLGIDGESRGAARHVIGLIVLLGLLGGAAWQFGYLDDLTQRFGIASPTDSLIAVDEIVPAVADAPEAVIAGEPVAGAETEEMASDEAVAPATAAGDPVVDEPDTPAAAGGASADTAVVADASDAGLAAEVADAAATGETTDAAGEVAESATEMLAEDTGASVAVERPLLAGDADAVEPEAAVPVVDFTKLPPPTAVLSLAREGMRARTVNVRLREDRERVTIDLIRPDSVAPVTLRIEEVRYSGNRSPWATGQLRLSNDGLVEFPAGQIRARVTLSMTSDPLREADQQITLRVRDADSTASELGIIRAVLEDDDQRAFESTLPANTVAFAVAQVSVREQDPAVQIDVLRFNPDNTPMTVDFVVRDITATRGEDYFPPGSYSIKFGPGQRSARILIPLVQDSEYEDNEAFSVELSSTGAASGSDIYRRTAVMIRDDDL